MKEWTEGRKKSFIISGLRGMYRRWPPKFETLKDAFVGKKINVKSGRMAAHYICAICGNDYPAKEVNIDHIEPVVSIEGFVDYNTFIERLLCTKDNLQVLCSSCHDTKTKKEKLKRKLINVSRKTSS